MGAGEVNPPNDRPDERAGWQIGPGPVPPQETAPVQQYLAGTSAQAERPLEQLAAEVVQLRYALTALAGGSLARLLLAGETPRPEPDEHDHPNYQVRITTIRTDAAGNYERAVFVLLQDVPGLGRTNQSFSLSKKDWAEEFKRAQDQKKKVCLRWNAKVKTVDAIEVLEEPAIRWW